ncbi:MAG: hypothetical protein JWM85_3615 [Acidimicrobiaceae bacterium]|nr:hypothetical protein [Acidimicrobiaceae bacterium]
MASPFAVGDLVMFRNRAQIGIGLEVQDVDTNMFDSFVKVDWKWWPSTCFQPLSEWLKANPHYKRT